VAGVTIVETATAITGTRTGTGIVIIAAATVTGTGIATIMVAIGIGAIAAARRPQKVEDILQNTGDAAATLGAHLPEAAAHPVARSAMEGTTTPLLRPPLLLLPQQTPLAGEGRRRALSVLPLLTDASSYRFGTVWICHISFCWSFDVPFLVVLCFPFLSLYFAFI
jgi:hypothetical protein